MNEKIKERVYMQVYATFATCLVLVAYMVFAAQLVSAASISL